MSTSDTNSIKDIPDIPKVPREILKSASAGRLVIFIGAGVSRIIGCPSWKNFSLNYLRYLYENKCINYYEYENLSKLDARKLLSICRKILEDKKDIKPPDIKSLLKGDESLNEKYKIYESLCAFNSIYVTTNYDDYLDQVVQKSYPGISTVSKSMLQPNIGKEQNKANKILYEPEELLVSNLDLGTVVHLHGSIKDEKSMIMTIVDYMRHYERDSKPAVLIEEIFKSYTVLFVGYGLEEYEILEFMISKSQTGKGELKHFMLYPIFKIERNLLEFQGKYYADLGIQLVPYPIDENGYEHLAIVIYEWAKQIGHLARPQNFLDRVKLIDEVI